MGEEELGPSEAIDDATFFHSWSFLPLSGWNSKGVYVPVVCLPAELPKLGEQPGREVVTSMSSSDPLQVWMNGLSVLILTVGTLL